MTRVTEVVQFKCIPVVYTQWYIVCYCDAQTGKDYKSPRKPIQHVRHVQSPGAEPGAPAFMRDTMSSCLKHVDMPEPPRTPAA